MGKPLNKADLLEGEWRLSNRREQQATEADDTELALASITPLLPTTGLLAISETCAAQSEAYLEGLFSNRSEKIWAKKSKGREYLLKV